MATVPVTLSLPCCPRLTWKSLSLPSDLSLGSAGIGKEWARDLGVIPVVGLPFGHIGAFCPSPLHPPHHFSHPSPGPSPPLLSEPHLAPFRTPAVEKNKEKDRAEGSAQKGAAQGGSSSSPSSLWHSFMYWIPGLHQEEKLSLTVTTKP